MNPFAAVLSPIIRTLPPGWSYSKFGAEFLESTERNGDSPIGPMLSVSSYRGVYPQDEDAPQKPSESVARYRTVRRGQLAANMMWLNFGGLGVSNFNGYISPAYKAFWISDRIEPRYAHHLLRSNVYIETFRSLGTGVRPNSQMVATPLLNMMPIIMPPLETQRRIADFLDRETAEIDAMDADLDRLIETLQERRVATVDAQLTEQRDVPEVGLGLVADAITGLTYAPEDVVEEGGTVVHRSGSIQDNRIDRRDLIRVSTEIPERLRFQRDDILVCSRNGSAHLVGKNALVGECEVGETWGAFMTVVRSPYARYLLWYLRSSLFSNERGRYSTSTINQLTIGTLRSLKLPFPSTGEQRRIADHLDRETAEIDSMIEDARRLKEVLAERRSVLISDVVTGRKEVPA